MTPEEAAVDWTPLLKYSENTIVCKCGCTYRSHAKYLASLRTMVTRKPCPGCGNTAYHVRRAITDIETDTT